MKKTTTLEVHFGKADLKSGREVTPGHESSLGVPMILHLKNERKQFTITKKTKKYEKPLQTVCIDLLLPLASYSSSYKEMLSGPN